MWYSREIEGLNSVKHVPCRETLSLASREANKRLGGGGFGGGFGGAAEAVNRGCVYFA